MTTPLIQARRLLSAAVAAALLAGCVVDAPPEDEATEPGADDGEVRALEITEPDEAPGAVVGEPLAVEPAVVETEGDLCLYANEVPFFPGIQHQTVIEDGDVLVVQVTLPRCLSSSCTMDRTAMCRIHREDRRLVVESSFSYVPVSATTCTKDCLRLTATCQSEPLAAGSYELVHGDQALELPVPSTGDACLEDGSAATPGQ